MTFLAYAGFLLAILVALVVGYQLGQVQAVGDIGVEPAAHRAVSLELLRTQDELTESLSELDMLRMRYDVDRAGLKMVRSEIAAHKERILDLEERLQFFRGLMAPAGKAQGLTLRPVELLAMAQSGRFAYRIVVQQEARNHELLKGVLDVAVLGKQGSEEVRYPLGALSADAGAEALSLRFRYFQAVEGVLLLPEGFEPEGIWVEAITTGSRKLEAAEQFPWQLMEKFTHAGK
jgi:hypothetical protein